MVEVKESLYLFDYDKSFVIDKTDENEEFFKPISGV